VLPVEPDVLVAAGTVMMTWSPTLRPLRTCVMPPELIPVVITRVVLAPLTNAVTLDC
jgi:hypothetical protein